jgi:hypothetical protein
MVQVTHGKLLARPRDNKCGISICKCTQTYENITNTVGMRTRVNIISNNTMDMKIDLQSVTIKRHISVSEGAQQDK